MPAVNRYYSSVAVDTTLSFSITDSDLAIVVGTTSGFPTSYPYTLAIGYDLSNEELVTIVGASGNTLTIGSTVAGGANIAGRGVDGTSDQAHSAGEPVKHVISARDMTESQAHIAAESGAHGITGSFVGTTDTQTLTGKTITGGTVNPATLQQNGVPAVTTTGSQTLTNKTVNLSSNTLTGTTAEFNTALSDANFATQAGIETLTNKTVNLTNNTLTGTLAEFNTALSGANFTTLDGTETLSNKNISLSTNTLTGTIAEFNTALTGNDFATLAGAETLTNKTLTSPKVNENVALTATATELNYVNGVTSAIQTQLDGKQATITGAATTIDTENLTVSRALVSDASGKVAVSSVTSAELALLDGLTNTGWDTDPGAVGTAWDNTGWYARAKKFLGITTVYLYLVRDGSTITNSDVAGNMTDTLVYTLDAAFHPQYAHTVHFDIAGKTGGTAIINEDGTVYLRAMFDEDSDIDDGDSVRIAATYIV